MSNLEDIQKSSVKSGRRVVITGTGVISPIGLDTDTFWRNLTAGVCGLGKLTGLEGFNLPIKVAAHIHDFNPQHYMDRREARRLDRFCQIAVAAAQMAMDQSGLSVEQCGPYRVGTIIGSGVGGLETMDTEFKKLYEMKEK